MKTPENKTVSITFHSHQMKRRELWWRAVLVFPPLSNEDSILEISFFNVDNSPIENAVFEFAGKKLLVRHGKSAISYRDFIAGKHEKALWLYRENCPPVPGALTFT